jgi:hypothetical protein
MLVMAQSSRSISEQEAIADAMKALPANGAGYRVVVAQLEPSSKHFEFSSANGQQFGEDQVRECLVLPLVGKVPFLSPCRYYPLWVVALSSQTCDVDIAINALTGRFGGGGDDCEVSPFSPGGGGTTSWWQPVWG